jgi:hypothetical protein
VVEIAELAEGVRSGDLLTAMETEPRASEDALDKTLRTATVAPARAPVPRPSAIRGARSEDMALASADYGIRLTISK